MTELKFRVGFLTDPGRARERNEDSLALYLPYADEERIGPLDGLFVVADGMGGHDAGDQASRFVTDSVAHAMTHGENMPDAETAKTGDVLADWMQRSLKRIDRELRKQVRAAGLPNQAGSTATVAAVVGDNLHIAHVGDSRAYRLRAGVLDQLTHDHSWVAEQVRTGQMTPEEAATHPKRHMLTHCLGIGQAPTVQALSFAIEPGDRFLLCSDGLHGVVPDAILRRVLGEESEPQVAARRLVVIANEAGGPDNVSVIVIDAGRAELVPVDVSASGPALVEPAVTEPAGVAVAAGATNPDLPVVARSTLPPRRLHASPVVWAALVAGLLLGAAAVFGAWRYLGTPRQPSTSADTTGAAAGRDSADIAERDSTTFPGNPVPTSTVPGNEPVSTTGHEPLTRSPSADTTHPDSGAPFTEPETLDPGARS
jgi:serine/threonine protein phosphatase PrpC